MTPDEMSLEFDLMYNNIMSNQAPGLNEYEKSIVLTQAQEALVQDMYTGTLGGSFESTEEITDYLSPLVKTVTLKSYYTERCEHICSGSVMFKLPEDVWFKTYESAVVSDDSLSCNNNSEKNIDIVPVTQDAFYKTFNSPFRGPNERRALRLDLSDDDGQIVEIVSKYPIKSYTVRYLSKPNPIILEDLTDTGLSINGETEKQGCSLHTALHRAVISRAVNIAKSIWGAVQQQ